MFVPDMPNVPDQYLPVLVAEVRPAAAASASKVMTIGFCKPVPNFPEMDISLEHGISPIADATYYLWNFVPYFKQMPEEQRRAALSALGSEGKITILQQPKYGTLSDTAKPNFPKPYPNQFFYNPKLGYMGKDQVVFLVEMGEYKIKVVNNIYPVAGSADSSEVIQKVCGKRGEYYKIASASEQLTSWFNTTPLGGLTDSGVTVNSADLAGAAVGQTTGTSITLDTNAAGNVFYGHHACGQLQAASFIPPLTITSTLGVCHPTR